MPISTLSLDALEKLEFLKNVLSETLRLHSPVEISPAHTVTKKCTINEVSLQPGQVFYVAIKHTHLDSSQWQNPLAFIPDRFSLDSPLSSRPAGHDGKRNPFAYNPFFGG